MSEGKTIICCLPGFEFSSYWVSNWTSLLSYLQSKFNVHVQFGYSNNIYMTRNQILEGVFNAEGEAKFDFVLWMDDDNILSVENFKILMEDLEEQEIDGMLGWYWLQPEINGIGPKVSVGNFSSSEKFDCLSLEPQEMFREPHLVEVEWAGFGAILMKWEAMKAVGFNSFSPLIIPESYWGFSGDDISFFIRAKEQKLKFMVDKRVKVPHLKVRNISFDPRAFEEKRVAAD